MKGEYVQNLQAKLELRKIQINLTSKNAVMSQIWVALCTCLLIEYFRWSNKIRKSALGIMHLLQLSWFERRNLVELFVPPDPSGGIENTQLELIGFMGH